MNCGSSSGIGGCGRGRVTGGVAATICGRDRSPTSHAAGYL